MSKRDRDPVQALKAYLSSVHPEERSSGPSAIAREILEIQARLGRAREVEGRVALSDAMEALLAGGAPAP